MESYSAALESKVQEVYTDGALMPKENLCCPTSYDSALLKGIPQEILDRDYGCGDPSRYVKEGDVVVDLGSGVGKMCYMVAKLVGESGSVIGVDINTEMLAVARKYKNEMNSRPGCGTVSFVKSKIQDMTIDLDKLDEFLLSNPISTVHNLSDLDNWMAEQKKSPVIPNNSVDLVISNCVLNLVTEAERKQLIEQIFRVLKPGGRFAISDIISSKHVPLSLKKDPQLWADCVSGAFEEEEFSKVFVKAGFVNVKYDAWAADAWKVIDGIEFRSSTLTGFKPENTECANCEYEVIYKGPFSEVWDDRGHKFFRGQRYSVCSETYNYLIAECPESFIFIDPENNILTGQKKQSSSSNDACCVSC